MHERRTRQSFSIALERWLYTGWTTVFAAATVLMAAAATFLMFRGMIYGDNTAHPASAGVVGSAIAGLLAYRLWDDPRRLRGWRNIAIGIAVLIALYTAADLLFGGPLASGGDLHRIGHPPVVNLL